MDSPVHLERSVGRQGRAHPLELVQRGGEELLRPPAGIDAHAQREIKRVVRNLGQLSARVPGETAAPARQPASRIALSA